MTGMGRLRDLAHRTAYTKRVSGRSTSTGRNWRKLARTGTRGQASEQRLEPESTWLTDHGITGMPRYGPYSHPAVWAAFAGHLAASEEANRLAAQDAEPGTPEAQAAHEAKYRLCRAEKAHREAWEAATNSRERWTNMDWLDIYPSLDAEMHRDFLREVEADWEIGQ